MSSHEIGLADFLDSFRGELAEAIERAANERLQLKANRIDLELQLTAERSGGPNAKIEFKVPTIVDASVGGSAQLSNKTTHIVRLSLTPIRDGVEFPTHLLINPSSMSFVSPDRDLVANKPKSPARVKTKR